MSTVEAVCCRSAPWRWFAARAVLPWALAGHPLEGEVLEIGGGSGAMAAGLARARPDARLTLTDTDPAMVDDARRRLATYDQVTAEVADVTALPYPDYSFDAVLSHLMLHHVVGWPAALAEVHRVLRPGGDLVGYDLVDTRIARWIHRADGSPHRLLAPHRLDEELRGLGFATVTVRPSHRGHLMRFHARTLGR